jgi:hypothetical protein
MQANYLCITEASKEAVISAAIELVQNDFDQLPEAVKDQDDLNLIIDLQHRTYFFIDTDALFHVKRVFALKKIKVQNIDVNTVSRYTTPLVIN